MEEATALFVSHMEDLLQSGRAASMRRRRMVRARLVIDAGGLGLGALSHLPLIKAITSLGKALPRDHRQLHLDQRALDDEEPLRLRQAPPHARAGAEDLHHGLQLGGGAGGGRQERRPVQQ